MYYRRIIVKFKNIWNLKYTGCLKSICHVTRRVWLHYFIYRRMQPRAEKLNFPYSCNIKYHQLTWLTHFWGSTNVLKFVDEIMSEINVSNLGGLLYCVRPFIWHPLNGNIWGSVGRSGVGGMVDTNLNSTLWNLSFAYYLTIGTKSLLHHLQYPGL